MSKNVIIEVNGTATQITVDKLKVNASVGGTCVLVPEDETNAIRLQVTQNGTYTAADRNVYGIHTVVAIVMADKIRGKINGVLYEVTVDQNGYLVYTRV